MNSALSDSQVRGFLTINPLEFKGDPWPPLASRRLWFPHPFHSFKLVESTGKVLETQRGVNKMKFLLAFETDFSCSLTNCTQSYFTDQCFYGVTSLPRDGL